MTFHTVKYHSDEWHRLVALGYITSYVRDDIAYMRTMTFEEATTNSINRQPWRKWP